MVGGGVVSALFWLTTVLRRIMSFGFAMMITLGEVLTGVFSIG